MIFQRVCIHLVPHVQLIVSPFKTQIFIHSFKFCFPVYPGLSAVAQLLGPNCYLHHHGLGFLYLGSLSGCGPCWQYLVNVGSVQFYISCIVYSNSLCDTISLTYFWGGGFACALWLGYYSRYSDLLWAGRSTFTPLWGRDFPYPARPALGPTQPPVQWLPGLFNGSKVAGMWR